jgi:5-methyltetrahydrofolate--homocysteine methyltransferase
VTAANERGHSTDLLDTLFQPVVVGEGAMGTQLQAADLSLDDFNDLEGCDEISTRPGPTSSRRFTATTSKSAPTRSRRNTFGCNLVNLVDYDSPDKSANCRSTTPRSPSGLGRGDETGVLTSIK